MKATGDSPLSEKANHGPPATKAKRRGLDRASGIGRVLSRALKETIGTILPAILIALFVNVFVAQAMVIHGPSMQPNLHYAQRVMVIVDVPGEVEPLIKRVVALPGETVEVRGGHVFIDGQHREEPWPTRQGGLDYPPTLVPASHVFVLGDNRGSSRDSRAFGPVSMDQIVGRAWFIYWPPDQIKLLCK
jgi:signal peptidase I